MTVEAVLDSTVVVEEWKSSADPDLFQVSNEVVHHCLCVEGSWCNSQSFLSPWNSWIIDGLNIMSIVCHQLVTDLCTLLCIPDWNRDYVTCTWKLWQSCMCQSSFECSHIRLVSFPKLSSFLTSENLKMKKVKMKKVSSQLG